MKRGSKPHRYPRKSDTGRRTVSAKTLRCLEKDNECGRKFARRKSGKK